MKRRPRPYGVKFCDYITHLDDDQFRGSVNSVGVVNIINSDDSDCLMHELQKRNIVIRVSKDMKMYI